MKKGFRKVISLSCAVSMMLSCVPFRAISDGETGFEQEDIELTEFAGALNPDEAEEVVIGQPAEEAVETNPEIPAETPVAAPAETAPETLVEMPAEEAAETPAGPAQETPAETATEIPAETPAEPPDIPAQEEAGTQAEDAQPEMPGEDPDPEEETEEGIPADREIDLSRDPERNDWSADGTLAEEKDYVIRILAGAETDLYFLMTADAETDAVLTNEENGNPKVFTKEHIEADNGDREEIPLFRYALKAVRFKQGSSRLVRISGSAGTVFSLRVLTPEGWQLLQETAEDAPAGENEAEPAGGEDTAPAENTGDEPQPENPVQGDPAPEEGSTFETEGDVLVRYSGRDETVTVPEGIREIGSRAFYGNEGVRRVILPDSVELINNSAFAECLNLEKVVLSGQSRLATIGHLAFRNDRKLDISFAENVPNVLSTAFEGAGIPEDEEETGDPEAGEGNPEDPEKTGEEPGEDGESGEETDEEPSEDGEETGEDPENPDEEPGEDGESGEETNEEPGEDTESDEDGEETGEDPENPDEESGEEADEESEEEPGEEETDGEAEEELLLQESPLVFEGEDYTVTVAFGEEAGFPQGTELRVREILPGTEEYLLYSSRTEEVLNENWDEVAEFARYFDITFIYNEEEIEPQALIDVQVTFAEAIPVAEDSSLQAIHFDEEGAQVISSEAQSVEAAVHEEDTVDTVAFSSGSFSVYAFVQTAKITENVIAADGNDYNIAVTYEQESGIPVNADLAVSEILPEDERYENLLQEALQAAGKESAAYARFFDIEIRSGEEKVEPEDRVSVRMSLGDVPETETEEMQIVHFAEAETVVLEAETGDDSGILFETDSFSVYGVIVSEPEAVTANNLDGRTFRIAHNNNYLTDTVDYGGTADQFHKVQNANSATVWQFESAGEDGKYYIFTVADGEKQYMRLKRRDDRRAHAELGSEPQAFTVNDNGNGTFHLTAQSNGRTYYLNEFGNETGFAGWYQRDANSDSLRLIEYPTSVSNNENYILVTKYEGQYYVIHNDGTLTKADTVNDNPGYLLIDDPMVWSYEDGTLHHNAKEAGFTGSNLTSDFFYRYLDPDTAKGYTDEDYDNTTGHTGGTATEYYVDQHLVDQGKMKLTYSDNHISSQTNPGNYIGVVPDNGGLRIAGRQSEDNAAEIYFVKMTELTDFMDSEYDKNHVVNHIDISVESHAAIRIPLAYGEYFYKDETGTIRKLVVNRENPVTITVQQEVEIDRDDIKRANISTYTIDENGTQVQKDNTFYVTGYSGNSENDTSSNQVRIEGIFKVADLDPVDNVNDYVKSQRLQHRIYYTVTTTKDIEVPFEYNGFTLYSSEEEAAENNPDKGLTGKTIIKLSSSFDYWDLKNECPPVTWGRQDWLRGGIQGSTSGMDFALGSADEDQNSIRAIEITKYLVDETGEPVIPTENVETVFHVYRSTAATPDDMIGMDVDVYAGGQAGYDYDGYNYYPVHDKTVTVGDSGIGIAYDYDLDPGMIYITEDTAEENLPRTIEDVNGQTWTYKSTYFETEYVWRDDGIEYRRHTSMEYTSPDDVYRSIPEVLGEYEDINGIDRYNGYLEFYVYNVYTLDPIDVTVQKNWMHENGTVADAPERARITVTVGRYKLVEDPDHPISGDLVINHSVTYPEGEVPEGSHYNASYTVKQGNRVVRSGTFDPSQPSLVMKDLPAGTYTLQITEGMNGYTAETRMDGVTTTSEEITITAGGTTTVQVATTLSPVQQIQLVTLHVLVRMDSNPSQPHQNEFYYFPSGSTVVFTIHRPSRAYESSGYKAWLNGESFQLTEGSTNVWEFVDQKWEYTIPSGSEYQELDFLHTWGTETFIIKSVVLKSDTRGTRGVQNVKSGDAFLSRRAASGSREETRELTVLTGNPPVSDLPGMMYVIDDEWPSAEEGDINKVVLNSGLWSDVVRDLPPADSQGHKYLYYIESVEEQNVPDGTRVEILSDSKGYVLTSTGETVLELTDTIPDEPPKITLQKTDENGIPLTGASFVFTKPDGSTEHITINTQDGTYTTGELTEGLYLINEVTAPNGYQPYSGSIVFNVRGKDVVVGENLPKGVSWDAAGLTFTIRNQPESHGELRIMKRWLDIYGNEAEETDISSLNMKIIQMVQKQAPSRIVKVEFYYQGNGNGGNNRPSDYDTLFTKVTEKSDKGRGTAVVEFRWNDWTETPAGNVTIKGPASLEGLDTRRFRLIIPDNGESMTTVKVYVDNGNWNPWGNGGTAINTGGYINNIEWPNPNVAGEGYIATGGTKMVMLTDSMNWVHEIEFAGDGMLSDYSAQLPATYEGRPCLYMIMEEPVPEGYSVSYSTNNLEGLGPGSEETLTAYNRENTTDIRLVKVDKNDHYQKLPGAVFEVRKLDSNAAGVSYLSGWETLTVTTDSKGEATVNRLDPGYYEFREITAPSGYVIPEGEGKDRFYIRVSAEGVFCVEKNDEKYPARWATRRNDSMLVNNGDGSFTVGNEPGHMDIHVRKVKAKDMTTPLTGASFVLKQYDEEFTTVLKTWDEQAVSEEEGAEGTLTFEGLKTGYYELVETEYPVGYVPLSAGPIRFRVEADGVQSQMFFNYPTGDVIWDGTTGTFTVGNKIGVELPVTGGTGTAPYTAAGAAMILLGGGMLARRKRRAVKERGRC